MSGPTIFIKIDNKFLDDELLFRLIDWEYVDYEGVDSLTLKFNNQDLLIGDRKEFDLGVVIHFRHGYVDNLSKMKIFKVTDVEGWEEITVTAYEMIIIFGTKKKERYWKDVPLSYVVSDIAKDNGLKYETQELKDPDGSIIKRDYYQAHLEDLTFLYTLGRKIGYRVWIEEDKLLFLPRRYWQAPYMEFTYKGQDGQVISFNPKISSLNRKGKVSAGGVDIKNSLPFYYEEDGKAKRITQLGKNSFDYEKIAHMYNRSSGKSSGKKDKSNKVKLVMKNAKDAQALIVGAWDEENSAQIKADLTVVGNPFLQARRVIELLNLGKYSGKYYVEEVTHSGGDGYESKARLSRNAAFDEGAKFSLSNVTQMVNTKKQSEDEFIKATKDSPYSKFYERLVIK
jgi:phage protein D